MLNLFRILKNQSLNDPEAGINTIYLKNKRFFIPERQLMSAALRIRWFIFRMVTTQTHRLTNTLFGILVLQISVTYNELFLLTKQGDTE